MTIGLTAEEQTFDPKDLTGNLAWLHAYWLGRAGPSGMPHWTDIHLVDFPSTLLPWLVVMDVVADDRRFVFRYFGTERVAMQRIDMTGKSVMELQIPGLAQAMLEQNQRTVEKRAPVIFRNSYVAPSGLPVAYDAMRLPVTDDGERVGKILALSRFVDIAPQALRKRFEKPTPV